MTRRVKDHVNVGATREIKRIGQMLVDFNRYGLTAIGPLDNYFVILTVGQVVRRIEFKIVKAKVKTNAHATVVVHFEREIVDEAFFFRIKIKLNIYRFLTFKISIKTRSKRAEIVALIQCHMNGVLFLNE